MLKVFIKFIFYVLYRVIYRVEVVGRENWDPAQPKVVCPNHIDYKDPLVFGTFIPDYIRFMAKKELFSNRLFDWFFRGCGGFPVDRTGNDRRGQGGAAVSQTWGKRADFRRRNAQSGSDPSAAESGRGHDCPQGWGTHSAGDHRFNL